MRTASAGRILLLASGLASVLSTTAPATATMHEVLIDGAGAAALRETGADEVHPTVGLDRLMVVLLTLEQVRLGLFPLDSPVSVSRLAAAAGTRPLNLDTSRTYALEELMRATLVAGAPDGAMALAEATCGSVAHCLAMMNARAALLGMVNTRFTNIGGSPAGSANVSTAYDSSRLAQALLLHPEAVRWASLPGFPFDGGATVLGNANGVVGRVSGVDGLQAGWADGTCTVVASAKRGGSRWVVVVLGDEAIEACYERAAALIEIGSAEFETVEVVRAGDSLRLSIAVDNGTVPQFAPLAATSLSLVQPRKASQRGGLVFHYQVPSQIPAPVERDQDVGELIVERDGKIVGVVPARSPAKVGRTGLF